MPFTDGEIKGSMICSQAVVERVLGDASVTSVKIYNDIQSDNYSAGSAGWKINRVTGSCEFQDATIRGTLNASDITSGTLDASVVTVTNLNASNITTGTLSADRIAANSLAVSKISGGTYNNSDITFASGSDLKSSNYAAGTAGWQIQGNGDAEFNDVTVRGQINASSGDITGTFQVDITSGAVLYAGDATSSAVTFKNKTVGVDARPAIVFTDNSVDVGHILGDSQTNPDQLHIVSANGADINIQSANDIFINVGSGDNIQADDGTAAAPMWSYQLDPDTGIYRSGTNELGFSAGGTRRFYIGTDRLYGVASTGAAAVTSAVGTAAAPAFTFYGDTNTGMYRYAADQPSIVCGGSRAFVFAVSGNEKQLRSGAASNDYIALNSSTDQFLVYINSVAEMTLGTTGFKVPNVYNATTGSAANVNVASDGTMARSTSARRYKRNIVTARWLEDTQYRPVMYEDMQGQVHYGLIADEVAAVTPQAGVYGEDGEIENYEERAVLAAHEARIQRLERACLNL